MWDIFNWHFDAFEKFPHALSIIPVRLFKYSNDMLLLHVCETLKIDVWKGKKCKTVSFIVHNSQEEKLFSFCSNVHDKIFLFCFLKSYFDSCLGLFNSIRIVLVCDTNFEMESFQNIIKIAALSKQLKLFS